MTTPLDVVLAVPEDAPAWRRLAAEVEPLFGPMVGRPEFEEVLARKLARGQALCVRAEGGAAGAPLRGGLLWSAHPPRYRIAWLAVAGGARRQGIGAALVRSALAWATPPAEVEVVTFGVGAADGEPARQLYLRLGFAPAEAVAAGPDGGPRQVFRLRLGPPSPGSERGE